MVPVICVRVGMEMVEEVTKGVPVVVVGMLEGVSDDVVVELRLELELGEDAVLELAEDASVVDVADEPDSDDKLVDEDEDDFVELPGVVETVEELELRLDDEEIEVEDAEVGTSVVLELTLDETKDRVVEETIIDVEVTEEKGEAVSDLLVVLLDSEDGGADVTLADVGDTLVGLSEVLDKLDNEDEDSAVELVNFDKDEVSEELDKLKLDKLEAVLELDDVDENVDASVVATLEDASEGEVDDDELPEDEDNKADVEVTVTLELEESVVDEPKSDEPVEELVLASNVGKDVVDAVVEPLDDDSEVALENEDELEDSGVDEVTEVTVTVIVETIVDDGLELVGSGVNVDTFDGVSDVRD
ncbi:hypothetical protein SLS60_006245 [Paraconiothyrium brasiliense]|uniref:Uncharacterized protein n=1 Tax=Paraconiothyrium brasiliense TaxID=300254 RepID=A0ABR3REF2_9PLEO